MPPANHPSSDGEFAALVSEFATLQAQQRDARARIKDMHAAILAYMKARDMNEYEHGDCKVVRKQTRRTEGLKKEHIEKELREVLPSDGADQALANITARRLSDIQETLKVIPAARA